jgi:Tol biopolymer transport system component
MHIRQIFAFCLLFAITISACTPDPSLQNAYKPGFFYLALNPSPSLLLFDAPGAAERQRMRLDLPTDCSLFALRPAPRGRWIAVEWECSFGPAVELFDTASGKSHFALSNHTIDSRFLAWQPDGNSLFLKIGTLSIPQTLLVDAASGRAVELPISPFTYDLASSPDGKRIIYSLTKGIGFGSETWLAGTNGQNPSQLLLEAGSIIALAQYSPDGSQVAYIKFPDNENGTPPGELWLMGADGSNQHRLAAADAGRGFAPAWSPDGSRIAFAGRDKPEDASSINLTIYDLRSEQTSHIPLAPHSQPAWSPDGSLISISSANTGNSAGDTINVWFYDVANGQVKQLAEGACCAGWIR